MFIDKLIPFRPYNKLLLQKENSNKQNYVFVTISENDNIMNLLSNLEISPKTNMRFVSIPFINTGAISRMTPDQRKGIQERGYLPKLIKLGDYRQVAGRNFILDFNNHFQALSRKFRLRTKVVKNSREFKMINHFLTTGLKELPPEFEKVLVYSIDLSKPFEEKILYRRSMVLLEQLKDTPLFDKLLLVAHDNIDSKVILLYDKNKKKNIPRLKAVLKAIKPSGNIHDISNEIANNVDEESDLVSQLNKSDRGKLKNIIKNYVSNQHNDEEASALKGAIDNSNIRNSLVYNAVATSAVGDKKAPALSKLISNAPDKNKIGAVKKLLRTSLNPTPAKSASSNPLIREANPSKLIDGKIPTHLFDKRQIDFNESMRDDLKMMFKRLETKNIKLKLKSMDIKVISTGPSELEPTIKDRYFIKLEDEDKQEHEIQIDLPHLDKNGTFETYGNKKVMISQLVKYPIFGVRPFEWRLETSYSTMYMYSKELRKYSYLFIHIAGYKMPLIVLLGYTMGFKNAMDKFGVKYKITDSAIKEADMSYLIGGDKKIVFTVDEKNQSGIQLVNSFFKTRDNHSSMTFDIESDKFWQTLLEKETGNRNSIYVVEQTWQNVITPIEFKLLASRGDPTNIDDILKYMADKVVSGAKDDRNSLEKHRIRASELFVSIIQKQINAGYNEFELKRLSGDMTAKLYVNPTKAFSEVINSQNVAQFESINPLEELSIMTRVSPIGMGGVVSSNQFPKEARNIHYTYYGNIDPLETPVGKEIGIQQHLTVGASITSDRGMFDIKDKKKIKPSEILSTGPASVPFVESNDGARVTMGVSQTKQAIPLENPEIPAVQSGYETLLTNLLSNSFIKKSPVDGKIKSIENNIISITKNGGGIANVGIEPLKLHSGQGLEGLSSFKPTVKPGQSVKEGDIIAEGANIVDGCISNGSNLLIALMPWKGYNFEDGIAISESCADKFVSSHIEETRAYIGETEDIAEIALEGDVLQKGDPVVSYSSSVYDTLTLKYVRTGGGEVAKLEIFSNVAEDKIPEKLKDAFYIFKDRYIKLHGKYPTGTFKEKGKPFEGILLKYTIVQRLRMMKGDKLSNRHGAKGIVSIIEPEENMPITPWGEQIQMVQNPIGIINRMNMGQLLELHTGLMSKKLNNLLLSSSKTSFIPILTRVMNELDNTQEKTYSKSLIRWFKSINDKQYKQLQDKQKKTGFFPIIMPPFKSPPRDRIIKAMGILGLKDRYKLKIPEYNRTTDPVAVGYMYYHKLEHVSEKKIHARGVGPYTSRTFAPTAGKKASGGNKIGEFDLYSLFSWDCPTLIDEFYGPISSDHGTKNEMISDIIHGGKTDFKKSKGGAEKDLFYQMMVGLHLEIV